ncbi:MAG: hypothetical protein IT581_14465 [Verrucomicrobiales bacterium]|nr:hypothetical protein [Verrucomicrobiales bacterium]
MNGIQQWLVCGALAGLLVGCGGPEEAKLDPAGLEAAFKDAPAAAVAPAAEEESTTDAITIPASGEVPIKEVASKAAAAIRKDDYAEAMVMLQTLRRAKNLSADQLTAVQDQMGAFQSGLAAKAADGDARAKKALELIQNSTRW